ncbi:MAG: Rieske 2Fe-2S domain-containing protein [Verrucomicrobiota bacterium]
MSASYKAVGWNAFKKRYDIVLALSVVGFLIAFIAVGMALYPTAQPMNLLIRATATAAWILLHFILIIGPLARLDRRWLPVLYNRRHLGVTMFLVAFIHGALSTLYYHGAGSVNPIVSIFTTDAGTTMGSFPFQAFGFVALMILFVMAATSHDFWLANLTAPVWKSLHMLVYVAYALLAIHVAFGVLQAETHLAYIVLSGFGLVLVTGLHIFAGLKQQDLDVEHSGDEEGGFVDVCAVGDLVENEPHGVTVGGERVAVVLYEGDKISAVSGVCQHQNGPLAEGKFVFGCLTCPWHGYQYKLDDGTSPPPFTERIPVFQVRVGGGRVWIKRKSEGTGVPVAPACVGDSCEPEAA